MGMPSYKFLMTSERYRAPSLAYDMVLLMCILASNIDTAGGLVLLYYSR